MTYKIALEVIHDEIYQCTNPDCGEGFIKEHPDQNLCPDCIDMQELNFDRRAV